MSDHHGSDNLRENDYLELLKAVEATEQGRWFLEAFARRQLDQEIKRTRQMFIQALDEFKSEMTVRTDALASHMDQITENQAIMQASFTERLELSDSMDNQPDKAPVSPVKADIRHLFSSGPATPVDQNDALEKEETAKADIEDNLIGDIQASVDAALSKNSTETLPQATYNDRHDLEVAESTVAETDALNVLFEETASVEADSETATTLNEIDDKEREQGSPNSNIQEDKNVNYVDFLQHQRTEDEEPDDEGAPDSEQETILADDSSPELMAVDNQAETLSSPHEAKDDMALAFSRLREKLRGHKTVITNPKNDADDSGDIPLTEQASPVDYADDSAIGIDDNHIITPADAASTTEENHLPSEVLSTQGRREDQPNAGEKRVKSLDEILPVKTGDTNSASPPANQEDETAKNKLSSLLSGLKRKPIINNRGSESNQQNTNDTDAVKLNTPKIQMPRTEEQASSEDTPAKDTAAQEIPASIITDQLTPTCEDKVLDKSWLDKKITSFAYKRDEEAIGNEAENDKSSAYYS